MPSLGYTALDIAKWFINATDRESGDAPTHLKIQKLVYYAQGWALALIGRPLFDEELQAWAHGPVAVSVWNQFRDSTWEPLPAQKITRHIAGDAERLLRSVDRKYGIYSAKQLERMTHGESPWLNAREGIPPEAKSDAVISKSDMKRFFKDLRRRAAS